ncbi:MAG: EAL domain-containing protein [Ruminiclostridium sp.]|nr:EAL domain-containing protein [Ruminiclostridium sp.]
MEQKLKGIRNTLKNTELFFVCLIIFVVISIVILMAIYIPTFSAQLTEQAESAVSSSLAATSVNVQSYFTGRIESLRGFSNRFTGTNLADSQSIEKACADIAAASGFRHVGFTQPDGITISSFGESENTSHRAFIKEGLAGKTTHYANVNCDFDNAPADMYTVPVRGQRGAIIGTLTGDTPPFVFSDVKLVGVSGDNSCFFVFDPEGDVVYTSEGNAAGISLNSNLISMIGDEAVSKDISFTLNSFAGGTVKHIQIAGRNFIAAFSNMPESDWTIAAIVPDSVAYASFAPMISFTMMLIIIMALIMLAVAIFATVKVSGVKAEIEGAVTDGLRVMYTDSLTGHDTIARFREHYAVAMKDTATKHALISLDVDGFKAVNDLFGYEGGNDVIRKMSDVIKRNIGNTDFFARSAGDLFYIFADFSDKKELVDLAKRIMSDMEYQISGIKLELSIGIYIIDDPHIKSRVAADRADMARDSLKDNKQSGYAFFDNSMLEKIRREKRIEDIMEDSLALGEFIVYLQPKFSLDAKNEVVGAEALVRWLHEGKLIPPGDFIPVFEKNGFVTRIDYYMFEEVCKLQKKYASMGLTPKCISVNMSRVHLNKPHFVADLASICDKYGVRTDCIEIEITESAAYENAAKLFEIFKEIKSYGFHVSIDDFGTGYSSLNMLKDLPVDVLKIDRSFLTEDADEHENASLIIGCVVSLAASLSIHTICEGIETKEQATLLTKLGCNMAQGFFFARPMPVPDYEKLAYGIGA